MKSPRKQLAQYIATRINLNSLESSRPVLEYLADRGHVSLSQIAGALNLSRGTCNLHLQRLEHEQYIRRFESKRRGAGRPTVIWGWDEPNNLTLSLVFDVPFLHASVADFGLNPILREVRDLTGVESREELSKLVEDFSARARDMAAQRGARLRQAMVYLPGLLDPVTGAVRKAANFPLLEGIDFRPLIAASAELSCRTAPLGLAYYFGESESLPRDANTMIIYWDLGVGVAFGHGDHICSLGVNREDGKPTLPELGHVRIEKNGRRCHCGRQGCLEAYTGGWALMDMLKRKSAHRLGDLIRLVEHGDGEALRLARGAAELLGRHLAWAIQVMGTDCIRVCGPMTPVFERVHDAFVRGLSELLTQEEVKRLNPSASPVREERFLRGAHRLARRLFTHPDEYGLLLQTPESLERHA
ncbi:MAG TPA: ROK family transcriptional regulator [Kiritimatiellia bacterium]|nr:ROK family transcriptional regulator [Kiritimatiellia bacterium]